MRIINKTLMPIKVFIWHNLYGYGPDVMVESGKTAEVFGPRIMVGNKRYRLALKGEIFCEMANCENKENDENHFQILKGCPLIISDANKADRGIVLRYGEDERPFNPN